MADSKLLLDPHNLIWNHLRRRAEESPEREAVIHVSANASPYRWQWGELMRAASTAARWLSEHGIRQGDVCGLIIRHNPYFYPVYLAVSSLGALPAVLAYPNARLHPDKFRQGLMGMAQRSGLDHILTERELEAVVAPLVAGQASTIRQVLYPVDSLSGLWLESDTIAEHAPGSAEDACLLQHSSGTTGLQKPVALSHRAVLEHIGRYGDAIRLNEADRVVSWLPLYHDMGLIAAFYLPLVYGIPLVQLSPMEWVAAPVLLLQAIAQEQGTLSWLPNFAYQLMTDRIRESDLESVRLDTVRMLINCSEPVRSETHEHFYQRFKRYGLRREALGACYAMAETTFAVTQTPAGHEAHCQYVNREELAQGNVLPTAVGTGRACVSSGVPISGCEIRILDEEAHDVAPGRVGEIAVSSVSLFDGYRNYPEKTAEVLRDGYVFQR